MDLDRGVAFPRKSFSFGPPKIFCQFDGSAHRAKAIGGAGAAMYILSEQGLQLLDWSCLSIPKCPDNIVAEVLGADLSLLLYERYVGLCLSLKMLSHPPWIVFKGIYSLCLVTCGFKPGFVVLTSLLSSIDFMQSGVDLLRRQPLNIGLVNPILLLIILRGKVLPFFSIARRP